MSARIIITGLMLASAGCIQLERVDDGGSNGQGIPDEVQRVFDARCNQAGCHGNGAAQQGLSLTAAESAAIIGRQAQQVPIPLVELGNVGNSYLAQKMLASPTIAITGDRMPLAAVLTDPAVLSDIAIVIGWIAGAELPGGGGSGGESDGGSSTGAPMLGACGLDELDPDATNPIVSGSGANQIPTEIGTILAANCGCHLTPGPLSGGLPVYPGSLPFKMTTHAEWHAEYAPGVTNIDKGKERVAVGAPLPMPQPIYCDAGGGEPMPAADRTTLLEWLDADAPDGANWP